MQRRIGGAVTLGRYLDRSVGLRDENRLLTRHYGTPRSTAGPIPSNLAVSCDLNSWSPGDPETKTAKIRSSARITEVAEISTSARPGPGCRGTSLARSPSRVRCHGHAPPCTAPRRTAKAMSARYAIASSSSDPGSHDFTNCTPQPAPCRVAEPKSLPTTCGGVREFRQCGSTA